MHYHLNHVRAKQINQKNASIRKKLRANVPSVLCESLTMQQIVNQTMTKSIC